MVKAIIRRNAERPLRGPCATALNLTTGLWLAAARAERVMRGAVDGPTVRDWLAANDGVSANAVVMPPAIGFEIPKGAGSPLVLIVMQDPGVVCPCSGCCFKQKWFIRQNPQDRRPTVVGVVRTEDGSITMSLHSSELQH